MLSWLERRLGRFAIPRLTVMLVFGQGLLYVLTIGDPRRLHAFALDAGLVMKGQWWRLFTFLFYPPLTNPIFVFFALYIFYLMGSALEAQWGEFRYNAYIFIAYAATVAVAFLVPDQRPTNAYIGGSVFLAFAYLYPDFTLYLFFLLPVKIKYLAWLTWLLYGVKLLFGTWLERVLVLAAVSNFLIFFGRDIWGRSRGAHRRMAGAARRIQDPAKPFHCCAVCGKSEKSHPQMDFRVCPECHGAPDYCADHIFDHEHIRGPDGPGQARQETNADSG